MERVVAVTAGPGYTLRVFFADGMSGIVDLSARLFGPASERGRVWGGLLAERG